VIHVVMIAKCRQFLERPMQEISPSAWRVRFVTLDLFYGLAWMFILIQAPIAEQAPSIAPGSKPEPSSDDTWQLNRKPLFRAGT